MNTKLKNLLLAYINKSTSPSEKAWVKTWISASQENEKTFIRLYEDYHKSLASQHKFIDTDKAYDRFLAEQTPNQKTKYFQVILRYAAIILMFFSLGLLVYHQFIPTEQARLNTIKIAKGKKNKIKLPDGTTVYMNAGSTLKFDKYFNKTNRKVFLDGEAYFDIAKNNKKIPFIVEAEGYIVRDIGTVFKIRSYSQDKEFEFSVSSGEISVENKAVSSKRIHLIKNQSLKINNQQQLVNKPKTNIEISKFKIEKSALDIIEPDECYKDWLSGTLTFDDTNLEGLVHTLERQFNVNIVIADTSLLSYHYSGAFKNVKSLYTILDIIKQTTPISYTINGKTITIKTKNQ